jgi:hypothetical protein
MKNVIPRGRNHNVLTMLRRDMKSREGVGARLEGDETVRSLEWEALVGLCETRNKE